MVTCGHAEALVLMELGFFLGQKLASGFRVLSGKASLSRNCEHTLLSFHVVILQLFFLSLSPTSIHLK